MKRFWRGNSGATAIEFALVGPILFLTLGMIVETGLFLTVQYLLQDATTVAGRQIRTGNVGPATTTAGAANQMDVTAFKTLICSKLLNIMVRDCPANIRVDVRNAASFAALATVMPVTPIAVGPQTTGGGYGEIFQPGARGQMGSLIVTYDWQLSFGNLINILGNVAGMPGVWRLTGVSVYRIEIQS